MKPHVNLGLLLLRVALGAVFIHAGLFKFLSLGYRNFVSSSAAAIPRYLPHSVGTAYLYVVPFAELIFGVLLVAGLMTRISALILALMLLSFMLAVTGFTDHGGPHASLIYMAVAVALALMGGGRYGIDGLRPRNWLPV
jgi:uncharacterized membrane protein YphA (DoxX/SURF4 family)